MHNYILKATLILSLFTVISCSNKYDPLVLEPINLSTQGFHKEYTFKNNYQGNYVIGLYVDKPIFPRDKYETNFKLELTIYQDKKRILTKKLFKPEFNFTGWENGKGGMALLVYKVPRDLPLNEPLLCSITVVKSDKVFEKKYGKPKFFVRKMSDK